MALVSAPHPARDHASRVPRAGFVLADATNVHRRIKHPESTKYYNPLFQPLSRPSKAPPTISLSATCANSSLSQALLPSPPDLPDVQSVIPFPSVFSADDVVCVTDIIMLDGTTDSVDPLSLPPGLFLPSTTPCSAQTRLRKRRSQAIATLSQPKGPRRDKQAKSKDNSTSPDAATRKRSRKSWRQVADFYVPGYRTSQSRIAPM